MTWQEERGMKRTVDEDGTVRYDGMVNIKESIENKLKKEEEADEVLKCEHCGANLLEVGITEVSEGGHGETTITVEHGYIVFGHTSIENMDTVSAICNNCHEELEEPIDEIIWAMEEHAKELPNTMELIEFLRELWSATEDGEVEKKFFELREKVRNLL